MKHNYWFLFLISLLPFCSLRGQLPESFTLSDFELRGPVKKCVVQTAYGEETFEFDKKGRLQKSLTQYNEADYDITYYRFKAGVLTERRDEVYRNGEFEDHTSIAHIYERDTLETRRLTEKIISYDQSFQERIDYFFNAADRLERIVRSREEGTDETQLTYEIYKDEETTNYLLNGQLQKSIRVSVKPRNGSSEKIELLKEYEAGRPVKAEESRLDTKGRLLSRMFFEFDSLKNTFRPFKSLTLVYNADGFTETEKTTYLSDGNSKTEKEAVIRNFVYQMDGREPSNWIRKIIQPENSVERRKIEYYKTEEPEPGTGTTKN